jgi:hypothetical protein
MIGFYRKNRFLESEKFNMIAFSPLFSCFFYLFSYFPLYPLAFECKTF